MRLLVIGAGPGGYETAAEAARRGLEVTLVTAGPLGGTCLNEGCIPTKSLIHKCCDSSVPLPEAQEFRKAVVAQLQAGIQSLLKGVELVCGRASFVDSHTVSVDGREYTADKIIIATGSTGAVLPIPGAELALGSKEILELEQVPERLAVIGGGVIGLEFACIFNSLGSKVTVIEYCPGILPRFDVDMAKRLKQQLVRSGIGIVTSAAVSSIAWTGSCLSLEYKSRDEVSLVEADCVLMAVGRRPCVDGLNLEAAGVEYDRRGIKVDGRMRTSAPDVYAAGDVTGGIMLAHVASSQGLRALNDICGEQDGIDFSIVPAVVFTKPELATVGLSEEDCKERGIEYHTLKSNYRANGKALASDCADGCCKFVVEGPSGGRGRILGCHILGADAASLIHEAAVLMATGTTVDAARWIIHAHPSLSEILSAALR